MLLAKLARLDALKEIVARTSRHIGSGKDICVLVVVDVQVRRDRSGGMRLGGLARNLILVEVDNMVVGVPSATVQLEDLL